MHRRVGPQHSLGHSGRGINHIIGTVQQISDFFRPGR
jgi:hypothetical protein